MLPDQSGSQAIIMAVRQGHTTFALPRNGKEICVRGANGTIVARSTKVGSKCSQDPRGPTSMRSEPIIAPRPHTFTWIARGGRGLLLIAYRRLLAEPLCFA